MIIEIVHAFEIPTIDATHDIGQFIGSLYIIAISLVGLAVFIQFLRAGLIFLFAAANAAEVGKAKEYMQGAVLGAILLLSSVLILRTINPDLTKLDVFSIEKVAEKLPKGWGNDPHYDPSRYQLNTNTGALIQRMNAECPRCQYMIGTFQHNDAGGERFSISPPEDAYTYIQKHATPIGESTVEVIGDTHVVHEVWRDANGVMYNTMTEDRNYHSDPEPLEVIVRVPKQ